jgi:hypothetical protein
MFNYNVPDSSITRVEEVHRSDKALDTTIKMGIVKRAFESYDTTIVYTVECMDQHGTPKLIDCRHMVKFGGPHNFEEFNLRPYSKSEIKIPQDRSGVRGYDVRAGDVVVVACLGGNLRTGVILGCLQHGSHKSEVPAGDIAYINCFNGIETKITKDGTYTLTFKGKNLSLLDLHIPGTPVPPPQYDPVGGGTFISLANDGSFIASDGSKQSIKIDKTGLSTTITSGNSSITLGATEVAVSSANVTIGSKTTTQKITSAAQEVSIDALNKASVKAMKVYVGSDAVELIDTLIKLIDAIGSLVISSPVGLCSPFNAAPTWSAQIELIKQQLSTIKA